MNFMDDIITIFVIISLSTTWVDYAQPMINRLNFKPFNCSFCLSFWISLFSYFVLFSGVAVLAAPLLLRIIERRLL